MPGSTSISTPARPRRATLRSSMRRRATRRAFPCRGSAGGSAERRSTMRTRRPRSVVCSQTDSRSTACSRAWPTCIRPSRPLFRPRRRDEPRMDHRRMPCPGDVPPARRWPRADSRRHRGLWGRGSRRARRSGRSEVDVAETAGPEMEALTRERLLQANHSPTLADLVPSAVMPHRAWTVTRYSLFAAAYNTNLVAAADIPRRYEDLLDPKWKGSLGIEADDANWFATVVGAMGEQKGLHLFREIVAKNGISIRKGHSLLVNLVVSGEVPLALTAYGYRVDQLKTAGAPIDKVYLPPVVALPTGVGIFRRAPHPFAAVLFADFMLTDGQAIMAARGYAVANRNVGGLPAGLDVAVVDTPKFLDERDKWTKL